MSAHGKDEPIFKADTNVTLVSEIAPAAVDPRRARVSRVHAEIARAVKTGDIYKQPRKSR